MEKGSQGAVERGLEWSQDLGSQEEKTSADFEEIKQITNHNERITLEIRFH